MAIVIGIVVVTFSVAQHSLLSVDVTCTCFM